MVLENELRIGSYVHPSLTSNDFTAIEQLRNRKALTDYSYNTIHYDDLRPIQLTEETLLKCGFRKWNDPSQNLCLEINDGGIDGFRFDFDFMIDGNFYLKSRYDNEKLIVQRCNNIKYIHQLQNLYFALTNKELEINL